jgi:hypothetical protein
VMKVIISLTTRRTVIIHQATINGFLASGVHFYDEITDALLKPISNDRFPRDD